MPADASVSKSLRLSHQHKIMEALWSPDGSTLAAVSQGGFLTLWDPRTGMRKHSAKIANGNVNSLSFHSDRNLWATASQSQTISIWDERWNRLHDINLGHPILQIKWAPSAELILAGYSKGEGVRIWRFDKSSLHVSVVAHASDATYFDWTPDGSTVYACSKGKVLAVETCTGAVTSAATIDKAVSISVDGRGDIAIGARDGTVRVFRLSDWSPRFEHSPRDEEVSLQYSPTSSFLACSYAKGTVSIFDTTTWKQVSEVRSSPSFRKRMGVSFSPNGREFATLTNQCRGIQLWEFVEPRPRDVENAPLALIMKGGGIKGLAYIGALEVLERRQRFDWFIGTSAGAIVAILLAAGYTVEELRVLLMEKDFRDFLDAPAYRRIPNLLLYKGMHPADTFTQWLDELLAKKLNSVTRVRLSDLPYRVTVYACRRDRDALTFDSRDNDVEAAYAVRCSMSIPFVFTPQTDQGLRAYDGGLKNNFPVKQLLQAYPETPFISLYLGSPTYEPVRSSGVFEDLLEIVTGGSDLEVVKEHRHRTVVIDPRPVGTLDFGLSHCEKEYLLAAGRVAAMEFIGDSAANAEREQHDVLQANVVARREERKRRRQAIRFAALSAIIVAFACYLLS